MTTTDFTTRIETTKSPDQVFEAIINVRGWWSQEIEGNTDQLNAEFSYHFEDVHRCTIRIEKLVPAERVVWRITDNYFKFTMDKREWIGNKIVFDINMIDDKTVLQFTQEGLTPEYECYNVCQSAWTNYIHQSLLSLINLGKGQPNGKDTPRTEDEKRFNEAK